ncbi:hypothetical protein [Crateriforma spongiae]|uniref:Uncharacterized protein n=1 Tax=Crateriforma conspicua TaxID=2527996 RepID=A0A5C6FRR1_9PLAN|nr:hypothetical protein V7x_49160 [Crateriforma conspicua]
MVFQILAFPVGGFERVLPVFDESMTADQLAEILVLHHDALKSLSLVCQTFPQSIEDEPEGHYWRRTVSVNGSKLMYRSDNGHGYLRLPWGFDPLKKDVRNGPRWLFGI